jgi:hypothetical protein
MQEMSRNAVQELHEEKIGVAMRKVQDARTIAAEFSLEAHDFEGRDEPTSPLQGKVRAEIIAWLYSQANEYNGIAADKQKIVDQLKRERP